MVSVQLMQQVHADPNVPQLQVMRKQVSRILQRFTTKRYVATVHTITASPVGAFACIWLTTFVNFLPVEQG